MPKKHGVSKISVSDLAWKTEVLAGCPALREVPRPALARMAEAMVCVEHAREHFFEGSGEVERSPVRVITHGVVALTQRFAKRHGRQLLGPGDIFGLESIPARLRLAGSDPKDEFGAHTVDPTCCLELSADALEDALGRDVTAEPLRSLVNAGSLAVWTPLALDALRQTQELSCMRQDQLRALIARATVISLGDAEALDEVAAGAVPTAFYVLLDGRLDRVGAAGRRGSSWGWVNPGQVVALNELFDREPMDFALRARGHARLLRVSEATLRAISTEVPGFLRAVVRAVGKARLFDDLLTPLRSTTTLALVSASADIPEPLSEPAALLARCVATSFHEDVLLVRVVARAPTPEAPSPWERNPDNAGGPGAVREVTVDVAGLTHAWLSSWVLSYWDVVLFDGSALGPINDAPSAFLDALAGLDVPVVTAVLLDTPARWEQVARRLPRGLLRHALPVAALGEYDDPRSPLTPVAPAPREGGSLPRRAADQSVSYLRALGEAAWSRYRYAFDDDPPVRRGRAPWPVGAARLVLTRGLYGTSAREEPDPATWESVSRLARALTRRRVGLALGGGGALSFVGSAMIFGLLERGVPIDLVSGTSFGCAVGAFYAVGGARGLRRLETSYVSLLAALSSTALNTAPLAMWADMQLGVVGVGQLATGFFPVATLARDEHEWDIRGGTVGEGLQCSGSLPPFAPTVLGPLRLLDGGFSADVPCQVLADEGADLIIAVNPFPPAALLPPTSAQIPLVSRALAEVNPLQRITDLLRGYQMLWRLAARSQIDHADVVFTADDTTVGSMDFWDGRGIVDRTLASPALRAALDDVDSRWRAMAAEPRLLDGAPEGVAS